MAMLPAWPDALEQALLAADEVYYADPAVATAGAALMKVVDTLGIGDQVRAKGHIAAGGKAAIENMALPTAARVIGATQINEIKSVPAAVLVGGYPAPRRVKTTYSAIDVTDMGRLLQEHFNLNVGPLLDLV
jgi:molybdate transport system substrate-binding protein